MRHALDEAQKAFNKGEVPVGAIIVFENKIIAKGHNLTESFNDPTMHAEMICMRKASQVIDNWRLCNATLYTTLEPCVMCAGAIMQARISRLVWGAPDLRLGANGSFVDLFAEKHPMHTLTITSNILQEEAADLMQKFFKARRKDGTRKII